MKAIPATLFEVNSMGLSATIRFYRYQKLSAWIYSRYEKEKADEITSKFWRERYH